MFFYVLVVSAFYWTPIGHHELPMTGAQSYSSAQECLTAGRLWEQRLLKRKEFKTVEFSCIEAGVPASRTHT
jgi:hypothetical protein